MRSLQILVSHVPSLRRQTSQVRSLIRCLLAQRHLWQELAGNMYVHTYNYECVSKLKNRARYSLFLERRYLGHVTALQKTWRPSCNKKAVVFLPEHSRGMRTHTGEPNGTWGASERLRRQSVLPLLLPEKRCYLKIANSLPDPGLVKWDRRILNKTACSRNHNTNTPVSSKL